MAAKDDPRTVKVRHPDRGTHMVTPEVAEVLERQGFERVGAPKGEVDKAVARATAPLLERIAQLEAQLADAGVTTEGDDVPDGNVDQVLDWVRGAAAGEAPADGYQERAQRALDLETAAENPRSSLVERLQALAGEPPTTNDPAGSGQKD